MILVCPWPGVEHEIWQVVGHVILTAFSGFDEIAMSCCVWMLVTAAVVAVVAVVVAVLRKPTDLLLRLEPRFPWKQDFRLVEPVLHYPQIE